LIDSVDNRETWPISQQARINLSYRLRETSPNGRVIMRYRRRAALVLVVVGCLFSLRMVAVSAQPGPVGNRAIPDDLVFAEKLPGPLGGTPFVGKSVNSAPPPTPATVVSEELSTRFGARFAGSWDLPTRNGMQPTVAVVDPTGADAEAAASVVRNVRVVDAKYSLDELEASHSEALNALERSDLEQWGVGVNVPSNRVVLYIDSDIASDSPVADDLRALADTPEIVAETVEFQSLNYPNGTWGGERIWTSTAGCTTGFAMQNAGGKFMTSAAHCFTGNGQVVRGSHGDNGPSAAQIGTVVGFQPTGSVPGDFAAWYNGGVDAMINGTNRKVKGSENPVLFEQNVCFRGASSAAERCAGVSDVNLTVKADGRTFKAFCIDFGSNPNAKSGDSGSAVYKASAANQARARGILTGRIGTKACSTPIGTVTSTYSASVLVK
jgi:hypothetical protein